MQLVRQYQDLSINAIYEFEPCVMALLIFDEEIDLAMNIICLNFEMMRFSWRIFSLTCALFLIWLMAAKEAMQWPGFWWCAWGSTSSLGPGGLRSLGVCVELWLVVVTSSLLPLASPELQREFDEFVKWVRPKKNQVLLT